MLVGLESMNRSVAGDVVVVELLPESQWKGAADDVMDSESECSLPPTDSILEISLTLRRVFSRCEER